MESDQKFVESAELPCPMAAAVCSRGCDPEPLVSASPPFALCPVNSSDAQISVLPLLFPDLSIRPRLSRDAMDSATQ